MTHVARYAFGSFILLLCVLLAATGLLLGTQQGARLLVSAAERFSHGTLRVDSVYGHFLHDLELSGIRLTLPDGEQRIGRAYLRWHPGALVNGLLHLEALQLSDARLDLPPPSDASEDSQGPFDPAALPLEVRLDALELRAVEVRQQTQTLVLVEELTASLALADGRLTLQSLHFQTPDGALQAHAEAELSAPYPLRAQLDWRWHFPATGPLEGKLALQGDGKQLRLTHRGGGTLPLDLELTVHDLLKTPAWEGRLHWDDFIPPDNLGIPGLRLAAGEIKSDGDLNGYRIALSLAHAGAGLPDIAWTLHGQGDRDRLRISDLQLLLFQGQIRGSGDLTWQPELSGRLQLESQGLDLRSLAGGLPPSLDAQLTLQARRDARQWLVRQLTLALPEQAAQIQLEGGVDLTQSESPRLTAKASWSKLRWPLQGPLQAGSPEGSLMIEGTPEAYRTTLQAVVDTQPLQGIHLDLKGSGNRTGLRLEPATADLLEGQLLLTGDLEWAPAPTADLQLKALSLNPAPLAPGWPEPTLISADGRLGFDGKRVTLDTLRISPRPGNAAIILDGWAEPADAPLASPLELRLDWSALAWPLQGEPSVAASPAGSLRVNGTPEAYRLEGAFELTGQDLPGGHWTLKATGTPADLTLQALHGEILDGSVDLGGTLSWSGGVNWDLELLADAINPAGVLPELPGSLNLQSHIKGELSPQGVPKLEMDLRQLQGRLLDRPLKLQGKLVSAGESHRVSKLQLSSGDNRIELDGGLENGNLDLQWQLALKEPATLLPGSSGQLQGRGRLGGSLKQPSLKAELRGSDLGMEALDLQTLSADLDATLAPGAPLQLRLRAAGLKQDGQILLEQARLNADGRLDRHSLVVDIQRPAERLQATLNGGARLQAPAWQGKLETLTLDSGLLGRWALADPSALSISAEHTELEQACLAQQGSEARLCSSLSHQGGNQSQVTVDLRKLAVDSLLPTLHGTLSAQLSGRLMADGSLRAKASGELSEGIIQLKLGGQRQRLIHRGGSLEAVVNEEGLRARLLLSPLQRGKVEAELSLPAMTRLPPPQDQPIAGRLLADVSDLTPLQAFVPQLSNTSGALRADIVLAGRLPTPSIQGGLELKNGAADVAAVGLKLRELGLRLTADPENPERWRLSGGAESGGGRLALNGGGSVDGKNLMLSIEGRDFSVVDISHARVRLDPDLNLAWNGELLKVRGNLHIPLAEITPQVELAGQLSGEAAPVDAPGSAILPSTDVVIIGPKGKAPSERPAPAAPALPLDSEVLLTLGEVKVDAVGFRSRITGELTLTNPPNRPNPIPLARGQLTLEEGAYRSFGQDLEIDPNSQLVFNGGPVTEPELQLRAIRWIRNDDQVNAVGVHISGTLDAPRMDLFSEPQLDEQSIHSYLLTGKAPDSGDQMVSIGTRLSEDLYVGYGINLLEQTHEFNLRYDILRWFALEADVGEADKSVTFSYTLER